MLVVGLTGGIGSGKSTVAALFADKGVTIIDTDQLARDITQSGQSALTQITDKFGIDILTSQGTLDRTKLRKIIFADINERRWLEKLLHPLIRKAMAKEITLAKPPYCIVVIPLLFETEQNPLIQRVLVVDATEEQQLARSSLRDQTTGQDIANIIQAQIKRDQRLTLADDIIYNDGILADLIPQVEKLHHFYLQIGGKK